MRKEKFVYNKQTLRYEKVVEPIRVKMIRAFAFLSAVLVFSAIVVATAYTYFDSPKEKILKREIEQMKNQYTALNDEIGLYSKVLDNLQERDRGVHRMIFGMDPIDKDVWNAGVGGSEKYNHLTRYNNTGDLMVNVTERLDRLGRQLSLQSKSLDDITELTKEKEKMFAALPSIKPVREDKLKKGVRFLSGFGRRLHPIHKVRKMHAGIDFTAPTGTPIYSTGDGKVERVEKRKGGYGKNVTIDHGYGYKTLYAHMSKIDVRRGQKVSKGEVIGKVGNTGLSSGPHLHYEVRYKGRAVNPIHFVMDGLSTEEYKNLVDMSAVNNQSFD